MALQVVFTSIIFIYLLAVINAAANPNVSDEAISKFEEFCGKYKLIFHNHEEHEKRQSIFAKNLDKIKELNDKKAGGTDAVFGVTKYSHLTFEEFKQQMLLPDSFNVTADTGVNMVGNDTMLDSIVNQDQQSIPTSFDWRDYGVVTAIRNQGSCGSCWAFCTAAALESAYLYRNYKKQGRASPNIVLSTQQLVSCETHSSKCNGGYVSWAMNYISNNGLHYDSDYPYTGTSTNCATVNGATIKPDGVHDLNSYSEEQLRTYLYNNGPFSNGFAVGNEFQFYKSGVFNPSSCPTTVNHAMLIVGYGTSNNTPYWLIKNQYGSSWGESGYIRVIRNVNKCSLKTQNYGPYYNI
uniref:Uncharacterized protein n=1 Tax=Ditylenchus dipsaci TaxID=166011 RepID=A0A915DQQ3_9BILA